MDHIPMMMAEDMALEDEEDSRWISELVDASRMTIKPEMIETTPLVDDDKQEEAEDDEEEKEEIYLREINPTTKTLEEINPKNTLLLYSLLPLGTKQFNSEVRKLNLDEEDIRQIKLGRRRIKNAVAARTRRHKINKELVEAKNKIKSLTEENKRLRAALKTAERKLMPKIVFDPNKN